MFFAALLGNCRLVTLDFFVVRPPKWQLPVIRWALGRVYKLLVYFRDSASFEVKYGLPRSRFEYVPFKVNSWELIREAVISDGGYIFVGGRSRRDFATLFEAVKDLPYPVRILTAHEPELLPHGSSLAGLRVPANVEMIYKDTDRKLYVELMANARLVVLPIVKDSAVQAGIGVYIMGMALRKCVIISEGLGVSDVLQPHQACIVPPGDASALRDAIENALERRRHGGRRMPRRPTLTRRRWAERIICGRRFCGQSEPNLKAGAMPAVRWGRRSCCALPTARRGCRVRTGRARHRKTGERSRAR